MYGWVDVWMYGCMDVWMYDNIHGCKGDQVFHSLEMNKFYEPVQKK